MRHFFSLDSYGQNETDIKSNNYITIISFIIHNNSEHQHINVAHNDHPSPPRSGHGIELPQLTPLILRIKY